MHRANSVRHAEDPSKIQDPRANEVDLKPGTIKQQTAHIHKEPGSVNEQTVDASADQKQATNLNKQFDQAMRQIPAEPQQIYMKSCLSDGDFGEILIKVNDQEDDVGRHHDLIDCSRNEYVLSPIVGGLESGDRARRRSSCSDAEDPKRGQA